MHAAWREKKVRSRSRRTQPLSRRSSSPLAVRRPPTLVVTAARRRSPPLPLSLVAIAPNAGERTSRPLVAIDAREATPHAPPDVAARHRRSSPTPSSVAPSPRARATRAAVVVALGWRRLAFGTPTRTPPPLFSPSLCHRPSSPALAALGQRRAHTRQQCVHIAQKTSSLHVRPFLFARRFYAHALLSRRPRVATRRRVGHN